MSSSSSPIVIAHHIMWTLYGWWLPNDPRGSDLRTIRNDLIAQLAVHSGAASGGTLSSLSRKRQL